MNQFSHNLFFVKEHVGLFKAANNFDILDPQSKQILLLCREEKLGILIKMLRFTDYKKYTPFHIEIKDPQNRTLLQIKRGIALWMSKVEVLNASGQRLGLFKQKFFSIGGKFEIYDANDHLIATLKGKWTSWEFQFFRNDQPIANIQKKWSGFGKELFTTADNYMLSIDQSVPANDPIRPLILAATMCIDMVMKE